MKITSNTELICLLGHPVKHSFSPIFQNAMIESSGLNKVYMAFDTEPANLEKAILGLKSLGFTGANVTIPHKENVMALLDEVSEEAKNVGAVNTVLNDNGKLVGYNTDVYGFIRLLKDNGASPHSKMKVAVLGTGGAAKAVVAGLIMENVERLDVYSRSAEKGQKFLDGFKAFGKTEIKALSYEELDQQGEYDVVVNSTPLGMHPKEDQTVIEPSKIKGTNVVFVDLIYNPTETLFLKKAKELGHRAINGLDMLIFQGMKSFEIWTGVMPEKEVILKAFKDNNII